MFKPESLVSFLILIDMDASGIFTGITCLDLVIEMTVAQASGSVCR